MGFDGKEWFRKKTEPFSKVEKAYVEADPTTYSPLPLKEEGKLAGVVGTSANAIVAADGESFVTLMKRPELQQSFSRLVKGIVPISDIVSGVNEREKYSKIMPVENIRELSIEDDLWAGAEFLQLAFGDWDHSGKNLNFKDEKLVFFDFDQIFLGADMKMRYRRQHTEASLSKLQTHLDNFYERIQGEEGYKFIESVFKSSNLNPADYAALLNALTIEDVQEILLSRVNRARNLVGIERMNLREAA